LSLSVRGAHRPSRGKSSAFLTASISTGAEVLWRSLERPMEFTSLAESPTASVLPAMASTTPDRRMVFRPLASTYEAASRRRIPPPALGPLPA